MPEPKSPFKWVREVKPGAKASERTLSFVFNYEPTKISTEGVSVVSEVSIRDGFETEEVMFTRGIFLRIPVVGGLRNCQDAAALGFDKDGRIKNFALADGVGGSMNGKAAAERATSISLKKLTNGIFSGPDIVKEIEAELQDIDMSALRKQWAEDIIENKGIEMYSVHQSVLLEQVGYAVNTRGELFETGKPIRSSVGSTTLMIGQLDKNHLRIASAADGGFMVVNRNGIKAFSGEHTSVPAQIALNGHKIDASEIEYFNIELVYGDVIVAYTDGIYRSKNSNSGPEVNAETRAMQVVELLRQDCTMEQIAKALMDDAAGSDDIEILAFRYE